LLRDLEPWAPLAAIPLLGFVVWFGRRKPRS
jgi:hypothetical protein